MGTGKHITVTFARIYYMAPLAIFFPDRFAPRPWIQMEMET